MNTPGFTAEASLYSRSDHYYIGQGGISMAELGPQAVFLNHAAGGGTGNQRMLLGRWGWQCWQWRGCLICCNQYWCWYACGAYNTNL